MQDYREVFYGECTSGSNIRMYEGNGDNPGTTQERTDKCAAACFNEKTALGYGPWSARDPAVGYALTTNNGRCYCNHENFGRCSKDHTAYVSYQYDELRALPHGRQNHGTMV